MRVTLIVLVLLVPSAWSATSAVPTAPALPACALEADALGCLLTPAKAAPASPPPEDAPACPADGATVTLPLVCRATLSSSVTFRVDTAPGDVLVGTFWADAYAYISMWNASSAYAEGLEATTAIHTAGGRWTVNVGLLSGGSADAIIDLRTEPFADTSDCGWGADSPEEFGFEGGTPVMAEGSCSGALDKGDRWDVYAIDLPAGVLWELDAAVAPGSPDLYLFAAVGTSLLLNDTDEAGHAVLRIATVRPTNVRFALLTNEPGYATPYTLTATLGAAPAGDDCGTGADLAESASGFVAPATCAGRIGPGDPGDAYTLEAGSEGWRRLTLSLAGVPAGLVVIDGEVTHGLLDGSERTVYLAPGEDVELRTFHFYPREFDYTLTHAFAADDQDDCGLGHDAPSDPLHTEALLASCAGTTPPGDEMDGYLLATAPGDWYQVDTFPSGFHAYDLPAGAAGRGAWYPAPWPEQGTAGVAEGARLIGVAPWSDDDQEYLLNVTIVPAASIDDCGSGADATQQAPVVITGETLCSAAITTRHDERDVFLFDIPGGAVARVTIASDDGSPLSLSGNGPHCQPMLGLATVLCARSPGAIAPWLTVRRGASSPVDAGYTVQVELLAPGLG